MEPKYKIGDCVLYIDYSNHGWLCFIRLISNNYYFYTLIDLWNKKIKDFNCEIEYFDEEVPGTELKLVNNKIANILYRS